MVVVKMMTGGGRGGGRCRGRGVVGFGIVFAQENDVVLAEFVAAIGPSGGARVFMEQRVSGHAEEALRGGGFTVARSIRIVKIHANSNSETLRRQN